MRWLLLALLLLLPSSNAEDLSPCVVGAGEVVLLGRDRESGETYFVTEEDHRILGLASACRIEVGAQLRLYAVDVSPPVPEKITVMKLTVTPPCEKSEEWVSEKVEKTRTYLVSGGIPQDSIQVEVVACGVPGIRAEVVKIQ